MRCLPRRRSPLPTPGLPCPSLPQVVPPPISTATQLPSLPSVNTRRRRSGQNRVSRRIPLPRFHRSRTVELLKSRKRGAYAGGVEPALPQSTRSRKGSKKPQRCTEMPRSTTTCQTLTVGQLARRWGISADRVRQLVRAGKLPGAFVIPSAGRYGETIKIPLDTILKVETEEWAIVSQPGKQAGPKPSRRRDDSGPALKHFPKLRASPEQPASGLPEAAQG